MIVHGNRMKMEMGRKFRRQWRNEERIEKRVFIVPRANCPFPARAEGMTPSVGKQPMGATKDPIDVIEK